MTNRIEGGETFLQAYNAENRMSGVLLVTGDCDTLGDTLKAWQFIYDGDGVKVKQEYTDSNGSLTTYYYAGGAYEVQTDGSTETVRQYYALAGVTAGMREGSTFFYFLTDHLGSVVGVTDSTGTMVSTTRYSPFGEVRTDVGTVTQTDYGYTFQKNLPDMGLMDYKARYYSSLLGRFTQPDSIIPGAGNPQAWNRFSYTVNNPIRFTDPSGHRVCDDDDCLEKIKNGTGKNAKPTTVKSLMYGGYQDTQAMIRAYISAHPSYEPLQDSELVDDRPALSFVATAKMQADNPNDYERSIITPESALRGALAFTPAILKTLDLGEAISGNGPPFAVGFGADTFISYLNDKEISNHSERFSRALIVGLEGVAIQQVSFAAMGGSGALGAASGPLDFAIMLSVYGTTDIVLSTYFSQINEEKIFPYLKERFDN